MIGQTLGSFRIESKLGAGAMGVVYRAVSTKTGKEAAVKVVSGEHAVKGKGLERFQREAEILQQFRHPNIVRFLAVGRYQGTSYFAMEFVAGQTLDDILERRGYLPWREAVDLALQVCEALQYAHQRGVVHRDLKPSNLMIDADGQVKLTDFGIAKDLDATALTATGRTLGTAAYMAPEQIRGTPEVSHKTDLYALGCLLYQLLTGELPFTGASAMVLMHRHVTDPVPRVSLKNPEVPKVLDELTARLMAKDPTERPWDAAAVAQDLEALREKAARGEPIPTVFPGGTPSRLGETGATASLATAAGATRSGKRKKKKARASEPAEGRGRLLEVIGLVAALALIVGFLTYWYWPPSASYYYRLAEAKMASKSPADWAFAEKYYLQELDRRHPDHPYTKQVQSWRDRLALAQVERRAKILESTLLGRVSEPETEAEILFLSTSNAAQADLEARRDDQAAARWSAMAEALHPDDPDERPWWLLARDRAEAITRAIRTRREAVLTMLERARQAYAKGRIPEAEALQHEVVERYGRYPDLAPIIRERTGLEIPAAAPEPPAAAPEPVDEPAAAPELPTEPAAVDRSEAPTGSNP